MANFANYLRRNNPSVLNDQVSLATQQTIQPRSTQTAVSRAKNVAASIPSPSGGGFDWNAFEARQAAFEAEQDKKYSAILQGIEKYLKKLELQGQMINPYVEITPALAAQFLDQATKELSPYYQEQVTLAQKDLQRRQDYEVSTYGAQEQQMEREYGQNLDTTQETMAQKGFGYSGRRVVAEDRLAESAQAAIDAARRNLSYTMGDVASSAERQLGSAGVTAVGVPMLSSKPTVMAGQRTFARTGESSPLYSLTGGLLGEMEKSKQTNVSQRQSQIEELWRRNEENRIRADIQKKIDAL